MRSGRDELRERQPPPTMAKDTKSRSRSPLVIVVLLLAVAALAIYFGRDSILAPEPADTPAESGSAATEEDRTTAPSEATVSVSGEADGEAPAEEPVSLAEQVAEKIVERVEEKVAGATGDSGSTSAAAAPRKRTLRPRARTCWPPMRASPPAPRGRNRKAWTPPRPETKRG